MSKNDTPILDTSKSHMSFFDISRTASTFLQTIVNISIEKRDNDKKIFFSLCVQKNYHESILWNDMCHTLYCKTPGLNLIKICMPIVNHRDILTKNRESACRKEVFKKDFLFQRGTIFHKSFVEFITFVTTLILGFIFRNFRILTPARKMHIILSINSIDEMSKLLK